jgi:SAM-dependent methyltransferase
VTKVMPESRSTDTSVCDYFEARAPFWRDIYQNEDVFAVIHQERRAVVLSIVDQLAIERGSSALEIGCGAGITSVAIAQRGYTVEATDVAPSMLDLTRKLASETGMEQRVQTRQCDAYHLPFADNSFSLVLAIGVLPWLSSLDDPMLEMARVLRPDGYLIVTIDNRMRLNHLIHPFAWARIVGIRIPGPFAFWRRRPRGPVATMHFPRDFEARLPGYGLKKLSGKTLGFGPFWGIARLLPRSAGVWLHRTLQLLADKGFPVLRSTGSQYISVLKRVV